MCTAALLPANRMLHAYASLLQRVYIARLCVTGEYWPVTVPQSSLRSLCIERVWQ
jgi:hypothetical protein